MDESSDIRRELSGYEQPMPGKATDSAPDANTLESVDNELSEPESSGAIVDFASEEAIAPEDSSEYEIVEVEEPSTDGTAPQRRLRRRKRVAKQDAAEVRLQGRRALCKNIADIAPHMLKTVKLRVLGRIIESTRGLEDEDLTLRIKKDASKLADKSRVLSVLETPDDNVDRGHLKSIIIFTILLQEETYSLEETRLDEKLIEYEKDLLKRSRSLDFFDQKRHDQDRWHHYDTYRIVLEAAWRNDDTISKDECRLLKVLREHLSISLEEHYLIGAYIKRFPKAKGTLHTLDEIHEARKELQREGILWSYRDESNRTIDVIPQEIASLIRQHLACLELQRTNFRRILNHDGILLTDLRNILNSRSMDRYGNKPELIERIIASDIKPSAVLGDLDRQKLSDMCAYVGLKTSGNKPDLIDRLLSFYDDLTFEERITKDAREVWYANYELLASRSYADLRAKKLISKDLEIEHQFEKATDFLFEVKLKVVSDRTRRDTKADGRLPLDKNETILWDCKSVEGSVNLQDYLESQFEGYLRKERECGKQPLAFIVIGPSFTPQSIRLAHQFKARTNWDVALISAEGLKHLADQWDLQTSNKPFPVRLFNRTEVIDKERADFLLSLA